MNFENDFLFGKKFGEKVAKNYEDYIIPVEDRICNIEKGKWVSYYNNKIIGRMECSEIFQDLDTLRNKKRIVGETFLNKGFIPYDKGNLEPWNSSGFINVNLGLISDIVQDRFLNLTIIVYHRDYSYRYEEILNGYRNIYQDFTI